jgi:hypothetical protein
MMKPLVSLHVLLALAAGSSAAFAQVGTVLSEQRISETAGGFGGTLDPLDYFGAALAPLGDLDGDGTADFAVGAYEADSGGADQGAVWILFLNADGTVAAEQEISETAGGFGGDLDPGDRFGIDVAALGDLDGDGITDLAVGALEDDDGGGNQGAVWILFLNTDGTVKSEQKISATAGGFGGALQPGDDFGVSVAALGDLDGDGTSELGVGAWFDDDGGVDQGALWILFLNPDGTVAGEQEINETGGGFGGVLDPNDRWGAAVAALGDLDQDGIPDVAVGAHQDDDGGTDQGAVWILFLNADGTVKAEQKISATAGSFGGDLDPVDRFGHGIASLGDLDADGTIDIAVGAPKDDDGGTDQGAAWILFLNADGTVRAEQKLSEGAGGFGGSLDPVDEFGIAVAALGDLDGDGTTELAVGAYQADDGGTDQGAVWILFLAGDTTPPMLACPPSVLAVDPKGTSPGEIVTFTVTASDDVDPSPELVCTPPSGSFFPRGPTLVTCTATDASGNESVCAFPVVVMPTARERRL